MTDQEKHENLPVARHLLPNSASENNLVSDHSILSRYAESLPSVNVHNEQTGSNLSRFPDDFTNLNDSNLDTTSPIKASAESSDQISVDNEKLFSDDANTEPEKLEEPKDLGRWDDTLKEHEKQQQAEKQEENNEILPNEEKPVDTTPVHSANPPVNNITLIYVREFLPTSADDPILSTLRDLFVRSSDEFYTQTETQLQLTSDKSLLQWLDETFDVEEQKILAEEYRCLLLCGNENDDPKEIILGFLTLKEENEISVYIAQVATRLESKRRGYGTQLLQHLRNIYPPNTQYWGLCGRTNRPALQFCLKQGARLMENDEIAEKYGYDPLLYVGFDFVDTIPVIGSENLSLGRLKPNIDHQEEQSTTITEATASNETLPTKDADQKVPDALEKKPKKVVGCCTIL